MKKFLLIITLCAVSLPTHATTKCIKPATTCYSRAPSGNSYASYWQGNTDIGTVKGDAICSSKSGAFGDTTTDLTFSSTLTNNKYCWCRMITPVVSSWTFCLYNVAITNGAADCVASCAKHCANSVLENAPVRELLFNSLI